jgi:chromosome segregation ATPase
MLIALIISLILSLGAIAGALVFFRKRVSQSTSLEGSPLIEKIEKLTAEATELATYQDSYMAREVLVRLQTKTEQLKAELGNETTTLKEIEQKLDGAQKSVESREAHQQEIKSAKQEDETKLETLLQNYEQVSSESMSLEQKLAASLKNLDAIMSDLTLTEDQRAMLENLSSSLTESGNRLRDLLTEYQVINQRLESLKQQHHDLEDEYTKLVEQQLGE